MIETQVLMAVYDFVEFFSKNHLLEGGFIFLWGRLFFCWGWWGGGRSSIFKWGVGGYPMDGGISFDGGGDSIQKS